MKAVASRHRSNSCSSNLDSGVWRSVQVSAISPVFVTEQQNMIWASFCPFLIRLWVLIRLTTEFAPIPRRTGRYCGNSRAGVGETVAGDCWAEARGVGDDGACGDCAAEDLGEGFGEGFVCTSTSVARRPETKSIMAAPDRKISRMTAYATQCVPFRKINLAPAFCFLESFCNLSERHVYTGRTRSRRARRPGCRALGAMVCRGAWIRATF